MAKFNAEGIDGLDLSLKEFAEIPDEVVEEMLDAAAEVTVKAHRRMIRALGLVDSGTLANSIQAFKKVGNRDWSWQRYVLVYPYGTHGSRNRKLVTKKYKRSKHGRTYTVGGDTVEVTNNEVGFIHEFGAPRRGIPAKQWMRKANELCAPDVERAEFEIYDRWAQTKDL